MSDINPPVNLSGPALSKIYVVPEGAIAIAGSPEKGIGKFIVSFPLDEILFNPHCLIANNDKTKQRTAIRICRIIFEIACY